MPNLVNRLLTKEYVDVLGKARGIVVLSMGGVTVKEVEVLRGQLAEKGVKLRIVRNAIARRVLAERGFEFGADVFTGNVGIAYGAAEAAIHTAKLITKPEVKKAGKIKLKAGVLENTLLGPADAAILAAVPDQNTLRAQLVGLIQAPARSIATLIAANPSGIARLLQAKIDKQGEAAPTT